ncbi:hypothetical protein RND71_034268 [Anisodus tanguticus]|uniref:Uncharacterized protein n=1 Tax=Anisodus tanguticus TaxID=243964 RepID=A0AAE1RAZ1_9SOLA|nr:hypothetical protein RND71_034268 [Anisodus tanguticus]
MRRCSQRRWLALEGNILICLAIVREPSILLELLPDYLEWKLIYVGSAEDETYDQLLESVFVGPVNVGTYRFVLQADPPDPARIHAEDIIGVTVLLLTCSYVGREFIRRNILTDKPRVTKFPISFHPENNETGEQAPPPDIVPEADGNEAPPPDNAAEADGNEEQVPSPKNGSDEGGS